MGSSSSTLLLANNSKFNNSTDVANNKRVLKVIQPVDQPEADTKAVPAHVWGPLARTAEYKHLFKPLNLRGLLLKNRFVLAPMTRRRAEPSYEPNSLMSDYYAQFHSAGLEVTEAVFISEEARGRAGCAGIWNTQQIIKWRKVTEAVHAKGGMIFLQLLHQGRQSHSSFNNGKPPVAPSPIALVCGYHAADGKKVVPSEVPHELDHDEIKRVIEDYRIAALSGIGAGFDGIEITACYGFLIDQFLQSKSNIRTDMYGGSVENRSRFACEVLDAVIGAVGKDRVGIRFSPNANSGEVASPEYRAQFKHVIAEAGKRDIAYVHVIDGISYGFHAIGEPFSLREARKVLPRTVALIGNCGYTPESANDRIECGDADMISFGRHFLGNPDLPERVSHGWPLSDPPERSLWNTVNDPQSYAKGYIMPCYKTDTCPPAP